MKFKRVITLLLALFLIFSTTLAGCGEKSNSKEAIINLGTEPPQMNPILTSDVASMNILRATGEGLVRLDQNSRPIPGMAEKWIVSPDGLNYTFKLRDAKWSNGKPVTAYDFEFAWKSVLKPENAATYPYVFYMIKGARAYNEGTGKVEDIGIKVIDDKTLEVTLEQLTPYFIDLCAFGVYHPVNQEFYEKQISGDNPLYGTEADKMLFNGPWVIKSWAHEDKIVLEKNPDYYNAKEIKLDKITLLMINDSNTAYNMFAAGEADLVNLKGSDQIEKAKSDGYAPSKYSEGTTVYFEFNLNDPVLTNTNIRKALTYAIDRESLITKIFKNSSTPAFSFTSPELKGLKTNFQSEVGNLFKDNNSEEAKQLLQKGLSELGLSSLPSLVLLTDDSDNAKRDAAAYQEFWKNNLGVDAEIQTMPFKSRVERLIAKDFQVSMGIWGPDYNDPLTFMDLWETDAGNNDVSYSSKEYDDLLNKIRAETDAEKRFDLLVQAEKKLMEDMPIGPLYFRNLDYVVKPYLKGVVRNAFQDIDLYWAYIDDTSKK